MLEPINYIAGGDLKQEIDLNQLYESLKNRDGITVDHNENTPWQLIIKFKTEGTVIIYRTGKYIIRGGSSLDSLKNTKKSFSDVLHNIDLLSSTEDVPCRIQNIVFLANLNKNVDLSKATIELGLNQTEYEPEQFPGVTFRPQQYNLVMLLFATGKVIVTGSTNKQEAEDAINNLIDILG